MNSPSWQSTILDVTLIAAIVVLGVLKIAPPEAVIAMLGMFFGGRAILNQRGGPPPGGAAAGGGVAGLVAGSTAVALVLGHVGLLRSLFLRSHA